ncbi:MAG: ribonuclease Z [Flavobacteriaceae bacterium]
MKVKTQGNTIIIQDTQGDVALFLEKIVTQHDAYKKANLILDISKKKDATNKDVLLFSKLSALHKKEKKSFVVVMNEDFDFNHATDKVMIVPTLQEAKDIIEMEEIERDLGF